jgi:hypothetical protein
VLSFFGLVDFMTVAPYWFQLILQAFGERRHGP